ncbi:MAG: carbohydrate-binding family 9-like protein [Planctomycetota bacterium]|nr:MAG: carbohydrate-binding family 9-like protein [Planctomycetota bacterium]
MSHPVAAIFTLPILVTLFGGCASPGDSSPDRAASAPRPRQYLCYRSPQPLNIDGKLDEQAWKQAPWTEDFLDIQGEHMPRPRHRTRTKMLWDDKYLYFGAWLDEPHLWATLTKRDSVIFHDNDFEVFIDPDGDSHQYMELEINALGTEWDLFLIKPYRDGGPALHDWDMQGLRSAVALFGTLNDSSDSDRGWSVEIAIPWKTMKEAAGCATPPRDGDQWRINFSRVQWRLDKKDGSYVKAKNPKTGKIWPEDNWVWSPQGVINMHEPEHWGYVQFSTGEVQEAGAALRPLSQEPARQALRWIYHAQRRYRQEHKRYAKTLADLQLEPKQLRLLLRLGTSMQANSRQWLAETPEPQISIDHEGRILPRARRER